MRETRETRNDRTESRPPESTTAGKGERLGLLGTLVLHSQFILIALLVGAAIVLKILYK